MIARPATARASQVAEVLRPEVWEAVRHLEDREEVRLVLDYFLHEAATEAQTVQGARSLLRAGDLLATDLLYLERLVEALRARFEATRAEVEVVEERLEGSPDRYRRPRSGRDSSAPVGCGGDNVVCVDFGRRAG